MHIFCKLIGFFGVCLFACCTSNTENGSLPPQESIKTTLLKIQHVPPRYIETVLSQQENEETKDTVFNRLIKAGTISIEPLIAVLDDTATTRVSNSCGKDHFTVGQLAMLLIDEIEPIPFAAITGMQFDVFTCGAFPDGLLKYVREHGTDFQHRYMEYYYSKERQERLSNASSKKYSYQETFTAK